jgi:glucoamylase
VPGRAHAGSGSRSTCRTIGGAASSRTSSQPAVMPSRSIARSTSAPRAANHAAVLMRNTRTRSVGTCLTATARLTSASRAQRAGLTGNSSSSTRSRSAATASAPSWPAQRGSSAPASSRTSARTCVSHTPSSTSASSAPSSSASTASTQRRTTSESSPIGGSATAAASPCSTAISPSFSKRARTARLAPAPDRGSAR